MKAVRLRTEYLKNPLGIDYPIPRFFWNCADGVKQTAYQIIVYDENQNTLWDSKKIKNSRMTGIEYDGAQLGSRACVSWQVRLWDENDALGEWSDAAFFELGLLHKSDWTACWISGDYTPRKNNRYPVDCFLRVFNVDRPIHKARLYITACGVYEARINDNRAGAFILAPGFTDYRKRLQYQTIDVTNILCIGENKLTVMLADGWYRGSIGAMGVTYFYGTETKLLLQLEITHTDGSRTAIVSDRSFQWSNDGSLHFADLKDGEVCDLRLSPSYGGKVRESSCPLTPMASNNVQVTEHECFIPKMSRTPFGKTLLDFGQNISGIIEFIVKARAGQKILLRMAEHLTPKGELDMESIQCRAGKPNATPKQEIRVICADGENNYKTAFAVFGFRYAEVEADFLVEDADFTATAVYSDMEETGVFDCSNSLINRFVENTRWSMKGNFLDVPTDCPTRERAGWTGDVQIFAATGSYLMDTAAFFNKWLRDLRDRQTQKGKVHCIVPSVGNEMYISRMDGCCGWADAAVLVPLVVYNMFGDKRLLEECYPSMKAHILFQIRRCGKTGLFGKPFFGKDKKYISNVGQAFGEWLEPPEVYTQTILKEMIGPHPEEATAYLSWIARYMSDIAQILGYDDDIPLYKEYHSGCKTAYNNRFVKDGDINSNRQSKLVRPLFMKLLNGEIKKRVFDRLVSLIEQRDYRVGTGFLSTPLILPLLTDMGRHDIACKMMENEQAPGWLFEVKSGATTVWENWDGGASQNHYSHGSVCQWLFEDICGVRISGENMFSIEPKPGGTLTRASFSYNSIYGKVRSDWEIKGGLTLYSITIPPNTTATVKLPGGNSKTVEPGQHMFEEDLNEKH